MYVNIYDGSKKFCGKTRANLKKKKKNSERSIEKEVLPVQVFTSNTEFAYKISLLSEHKKTRPENYTKNCGENLFIPPPA